MKHIIRNLSLFVVIVGILLSGCQFFGDEEALKKYNSDAKSAFDSINNAMAEIFEVIDPEPKAKDAEYAQSLIEAAIPIEQEANSGISVARTITPPDVKSAKELQPILIDLAAAAEKALTLNSKLIEAAKAMDVVKEKQATIDLISQLESMDAVAQKADAARKTFVSENNLPEE